MKKLYFLNKDIEVIEAEIKVNSYNAGYSVIWKHNNNWHENSGTAFNSRVEREGWISIDKQTIDELDL